MSTTIIPKIIVGGWAAYAEEYGVNKKEPMETFGWIPNQENVYFYEDCKQALEKVDAKEWLKTYTHDKKSGNLPFDCPIGNDVRSLMTSNHTGSSSCSLLWDYKNALNNWDAWVHAIKKRKYLALYKNDQINWYEITNLIWTCNSLLEGDKDAETDKAHQDHINRQCIKFNYTFTTVSDLKETLEFIKTDLDNIGAEATKSFEDYRHRELISSLEFLYTHPSRWFDSKQGCHLSPIHPSSISSKAFDEMEWNYPGYKHHIAKVLSGMEKFPWEGGYMNLKWDKQSDILNKFMASHGIVAGVL